MRWLPFLILAYVAVGLQAGLAEWISVGSARPDFVLLIVVWAVLTAPVEPALLGSLAAGLMQDLVARGPFGTYTLGYGLAGLAVAAGGREVSRSHPLTHAGLTLAAGTVVALVAALADRARGGPMLPDPAAAAGSILYTALLAPVVVGVLRHLRGAFVRRPFRE